MELKEGMYVRTEDGYIDEVIIDYEGHCNSPNCNCKHVSCEHNYYDENKIAKASNNIIDLIEIGDYVNGWRVNGVEREEDGTFLTIGTLTNFVSRNETNPYLTQDYNEADRLCKIKSIVTKEQFESMEYKLEER